MNIVLATISARVPHVPGTPALMHTSATSQVEGDHPRIRCSIPFESNKQPPLQLGIQTVSTIAPATAAYNFGGVVTPVNVFNLQYALHSHHNINKCTIIIITVI